MANGIFRLSALTVAGIYVFLTFLFIWPLVDLAATGWPFQPGRLEWRYGFLGLMTAYWHTPILAVILSMFLSLILRHRKNVLRPFLPLPTLGRLPRRSPGTLPPGCDSIAEWYARGE